MVALAKNIETNELVAMKIIDKEQVSQKNMSLQVKKEVTIMQQMEHPHVIRINEVLASKKKVFIIMEYVSGGDLLSKLESEKGLCLLACLLLSDFILWVPVRLWNFF